MPGRVVVAIKISLRGVEFNCKTVVIVHNHCTDYIDYSAADGKRGTLASAGDNSVLRIATSEDVDTLSLPYCL